MYIVHVAAEIAPIAKVGGLADVVGGLSKELAWKGHTVDVIIPKYDCLDYALVKELHVIYENLYSYYKGQWIRNTVWQGLVDGISVLMIEPHDEWGFFRRGTFYHTHDNIERFTYFSRAVLEFLLKSNRHPDVLHSHDWHTGLIPVLYHEIYKTLGLRVQKNIMTIHNLFHQGQSDPWLIDAVGLSSLHLLHHDRLQDDHHHNLINILRGAIVYSDSLTTVSPTYAEEIKTAEGGCGLDHLLRAYSHKLVGILNGIDTSYWNPHIDPLIPHHYSPKDKPLFFKNKALCKEHLLKRLNMTQDTKPLIGIVSRLVPQKGIHLITHALRHIIHKGGQFVLMGSGPDQGIMDHFNHLKKEYVDNHAVHLELHHSEDLAHQIFAGCDAFLVPSLFEPCGLTQQIALKYASLPIVRRTGGLADTVFDIETSSRPPNERNGFTFDNADHQGVNWGIDRAMASFKNKRSLWQELMMRAANLDLSWNHPANRYLQLYTH